MVKISRIESILLKNYQRRFLVKVLHDKELEYFDQITDDEYKAQYVASRWAAKEATVKAIGKKDLVFPKTLINKDLQGTFFKIKANLTWCWKGRITNSW